MANALNINLRESIHGSCLSLGRAERSAEEIEALLGGHPGLGQQANGDLAKQSGGICQDAHDLSIRIEILAQKLEMVRGMIAPQEANRATASHTYGALRHTTGETGY